MAYTVTANLSLTTGAAALYALKEALKAAGWTKQISSDGTTLNSTPGNANDNITSAGAGAGGFNNASAHWTGRSPDGAREICLQRGSGSSQACWWKYSLAAHFSGGSATTAPTATDDEDVFGTSAAGNTLFTTTMRFHIVVNNAAPYDWYAFACTTGTTTIVTEMIYDSLVAGSYNASDPDPYVMGARNGTLYSGVSDTGSVQTAAAGAAGLWGYWGPSGSKVWVNWALQHLAYSASSAVAGDYGSDHVDNTKHVVRHPTYGRSRSISASQPGLKGASYLLREHMTTGKATYDLMDEAATGDLISHNGFMCTPWNNTTPTV